MFTISKKLSIAYERLILVLFFSRHMIYSFRTVMRQAPFLCFERNSRNFSKSFEKSIKFYGMEDKIE